MDYAALIVDLVEKAIEREESELKTLSRGSTAQSVNSVRKYFESWVWVPVVKEALRRPPSFPRLDWEGNHVDLQLSTDDQVRATFEFKPFFRASKPSDFPGIVYDFEKQHDASQRDPSVERYVILIPYGLEEEVNGWLEKSLKPAVRSSRSGIDISDVARGKPIRLNNEVDRFAFIVVFRVKAASAALAAQG